MKKLVIPILLSSLILGACFGNDEKKAEQEAQQQIEEIQNMLGEVEILTGKLDEVVQAQLQNKDVIDATKTYTEIGLEVTLVVGPKVKKEEAEKLAEELYDELKAVEEEFIFSIFIQQNDKEILQYTE